jgi:RNA polymerase sigma-70 factor (ECF subfamily)
MASAEIAFRLARACGRTPDEAADVLQEAATQAWRYRGTRRGDWRPWFLSIVYRLAHRRRRLGWLPLPLSFDRPSTDWPGLQAPDPNLQKALAALPARQRAALLLYYGQDLSLAAVARVLSASEPATKQLLARARTQLRKRYLELEQGT